MKTEFCLYCGKEVPYVKVTSKSTFFVRGIRVEYDEIRAHCPDCKREMYVQDINDINASNKQKAYRSAIEENSYE